MSNIKKTLTKHDLNMVDDLVHYMKFVSLCTLALLHSSWKEEKI